jgi:hypothetical protein
VRDLLREAHFVGHAHHGHAFLGELHHHVEHFVDHLGVERRGRLVEQHRDRVHRKRACNRHTLLLTARKLTRVFVGMRLETHAVEQLQAFGRRLVLRTSEHLHLREREVLGNRQMREQFEVLKHHAHLRAQLRQIGLLVTHRLTVHENLALLERLEAVHGLDERRFARARRAAYHDNLALLHFRRAVGEYLKVAVPLGNILDGNHLATFL